MYQGSFMFRPGSSNSSSTNTIAVAIQLQRGSLPPPSSPSPSSGQVGFQEGPGGSRGPGEGQTTPKTCGKPMETLPRPSPEAPWSGKFPDGVFCAIEQTRKYHEAAIFASCTNHAPFSSYQSTQALLPCTGQKDQGEVKKLGAPR